MPSDQLPGMFAQWQPVLDHYGYLAVGGLVLLEDFGVPVPGEAVLIAAAVFAGYGHLNIVLVVAVAIFGAVVGDNIGYLVGHLGGRPLVERFGKYVFLTPERLDRAESFFDRHGGKIVVVARFVEGLRQANGLLAGIVGMRWSKFLGFNALGAVLWVCTWAALGYFAGQRLPEIYAGIERYRWYVLAGLVVIAVLVLAHRLRRRRLG